MDSNVLFQAKQKYSDNVQQQICQKADCFIQKMNVLSLR